jgi:hypothetical protein
MHKGMSLGARPKEYQCNRFVLQKKTTATYLRSKYFRNKNFRSHSISNQKRERLLYNVADHIGLIQNCCHYILFLTIIGVMRVYQRCHRWIKGAVVDVLELAGFDALLNQIDR